MHFRETSGRDCLPPVQELFARNDVGLWQNFAVAADALESGQGLPKKTIGDRNVVKCLVGMG